MKARVVILVLLFVCTATPIVAQTIHVSKVKDSVKVWDLFKHDAKYIGKSIGHSLTRPLHWKGDDFGKLGILIAGTAALTIVDEQIRDISQNNKDEVPEVFKDFGWYFGNPQNYFLANTGLYTFGLLTKNEKIRKTSVLIISSSFTTGLIQSLGKSAIGRARPGSGFDNYEFNPFSGQSTYRSFPSGHTVLAITMSHSIAKQFENPWVKAGIYTIGAIPPISRLIDDAHWFTDIAFSTVLSIIVVDCIDNYLNTEDAYEYPKQKKQISWNLRFSPNQIGIVGTF